MLRVVSRPIVILGEPKNQKERHLLLVNGTVSQSGSFRAAKWLVSGYVFKVWPYGQIIGFCQFSMCQAKIMLSFL